MWSPMGVGAVEPTGKRGSPEVGLGGARCGGLTEGPRWVWGPTGLGVGRVGWDGEDGGAVGPSG